ncbi:GT2 family glycosyltransferase [Novosphingobium sp. PhB165]|uniref:glycosyltransferase family 2 protein n=1 Tax=Novosphingobium sp. PhB165 TaxID=2485105 RepID=UPI00104BB965|nr:glycosyltransferase family 2 protein [Novosphingobium sp. PhB165]TCM20817.1 GT2 family glycosyltransferase [Novosphingobium sp. PhB165]
MNEVAFVIIGRNEGPRLSLAIDSVLRQTPRAVYVDSGSSDGSVALAERRGLPVVELDPRFPFTPARARNAGLAWLVRDDPGLAFVHFIDGDCELVPGWLDHALSALRADGELAAACGRRRERDPHASPYNRLRDFEWDSSGNAARACGGDMLFRVAPFRSVGGFREDLIAGEEPDLCCRIRRCGWTIRQLDMDATIHDAAMTRFSQWWQHNRRTGYALAEGLALRGTFDPALRRRVMRNVIWAMPPMWLFWPVLWTRVCLRGGPLLASFTTLGKLPHFQGQLDYWRRRRKPRFAETGPLIEYK